MSTLKVNTIQNTSGGASSTAEQIEQGRAKAWVNIDGNGTVNMRDNFSVSSITDNGTGDYTVNFTNDFSDANYIAVGFAHRNDAGRVLINIDQLTSQTASAYRFKTSGTINAQVVGLSVVDPSYIYLAFFGDN
tara:strand:- start:45 stop:443 length:399 start_codon:yes stop_codon:yes gene_type:complete